MEAGLAKAAFAGAAVLASATVAIPSINDVSVPLLGVPVAGFMMALLGASFSFAWSPVESSRGKLIFVVVASAFVGSTAVGVIPHLVGLWYHQPNYKWPRDLQPPLAFLFGLIAPWIVPVLKTFAPAIMSGLGNLIVRLIGARANAPEPAAHREYVPRKPPEGESDAP